ncbi:MAG: hypothetical protein OHK0029_17030 [Armatimonadaceae bacterium]
MTYRANQLPAVTRPSDNDLFFLMFQGTPATDNTEDTGVNGAYINFWIDTDTLASAEAVALECLQAEKWTPVQLIEHKCQPINNWVPEYPDIEAEIWEAAEKQMEEYGIYYVFYCWDEDTTGNDGKPQ